MTVSRLAALIGVVAIAVFVVLTIGVTTGAGWVHSLDSAAFDIADDLRESWLSTAARVVTTLGLIGVVGPAVLAGGAVLMIRHHRARAAALVLGCAMEWCAVWIVKYAVDRPRPSHPLVGTAGASFPSAHAANSVGWLALALATAILIPTRAGRIALTVAGALLTVAVGLSRVYLRAHYITDVLAGEALSVAMYALAVIASLRWLAQPRAISASASSRASTSDSSL
jgi:undecaprenyl-diphosphatase